MVKKLYTHSWMLIFLHPITSIHMNHMTVFLHACTSLYAHHLPKYFHIKAATWTHTMYTDISVFKEQHAYTPCMSIFMQSSDSMHIHNTSKLSSFRWCSQWCHCSRLYRNNWYDSIKHSQADNHIKVWKSCSVPETDLSHSLQGANDGLVKPILVSSVLTCGVCLHWARAWDGVSGQSRSLHLTCAIADCVECLSILINSWHVQHKPKPPSLL